MNGVRLFVCHGSPHRAGFQAKLEAGGRVCQRAGPWRTSGGWWNGTPAAWDRDEWDVSLSDGAVYRVFRDRDADRWFIDAVVD